MFLGGLVVHRLGVLKSLFVCGVVQMLSNLMYITMAQRGQDVPTFAATIAVENISGGMTGVAFIAYLSSLCSPGFAGSQYALLSALGLSTRNTLSAASGWLAETRGVVLVLRGSAPWWRSPGWCCSGFFLLSGRFDEKPASRRRGAAAAWLQLMDRPSAAPRIERLSYTADHMTVTGGASCTTPSSRPYWRN